MDPWNERWSLVRWWCGGEKYSYTCESESERVRSWRWKIEETHGGCGAPPPSKILRIIWADGPKLKTDGSYENRKGFKLLSLALLYKK